jgi:hypothetical protein
MDCPIQASNQCGTMFTAPKENQRQGNVTLLNIHFPGFIIITCKLQRTYQVTTPNSMFGLGERRGEEVAGRWVTLIPAWIFFFFFFSFFL